MDEGLSKTVQRTGDRCPCCGSERTRSFYRQSEIPIHSCLMVPDREQALSFPRGELRLHFCEGCGFVFNAAFELERMRYSAAYEETQSFSPRFRRFLEDQARDLVERHHLQNRTALEIGCGKGEFLILLCEQGAASGIGIDPSYRPERTESPAASRIEFIRDLYSEAYSHLQADFVACRHTLEHIAQPREFLGTIRRALGERTGTTVFFELPELRRVLKERAFWDLYYEHCSYFSSGSLARLFRANDFTVDRLALDYDDQYLLLEGRPTDGPVTSAHAEEEPVEVLASEIDDFSTAMDQTLVRWREELSEWRRRGHTLALWGSGSKAVSYLNTLQIGEEVGLVVDINPHKWGKYLAGTGHAIGAPAGLSELRPDRVLVMNPIYRDEIQAELDNLGLRCEVRTL